MEIVNVPIGKLVPAEYNPRQLTKKQAADLEASIKRFGLVDPLIVNAHKNRKNIIIGGHQRYYIAREMGLAELPCVYVKLDEAKERELNLRLNKNMGEWDWEMLAEFDVDMLLDVGFEAAELDKYFNLGMHDVEEDEAPEPPQDPTTKPGDLYTLGSHRLLCGDSTVVTDVERLMGGGLATCMWTDPPYGVEYVGKAKAAKTIKNDGASGLPQLLSGMLLNADIVLEPGAPFYIAHPPGALAYVFETAVDDSPLKVHQCLVWVKDAMVLGHSDYHYRHEPILYGFKPGPGRSGRGKHEGSRWYGDHKQTSVLEFDRPKRSEEHPTMKPVSLVAYCLGNSTPMGGVVYDPFGGSGTTLIACEQLGRACCMMEIDPAYCDVIVERWEKFTGEKARLDNGRV